MDIAKNIMIIICDNVRYERGNKISIMGLLSGSIVVNHIKTLLPTLGVVVMVEKANVDFTEVIIKYSDPAGKSFPEISLLREVKAGDNKNHNFIAHLNPFPIELVGTAKFEVFFKNNEILINEKAPVVHEFEIKLAGDKK